MDDYKERLQQFEKTTSVTFDLTKRARRANSCGFEDVEGGFKIISYDGRGCERAEGFFTTRKEADEFMTNLPRCKGE